MVYGIWYRLDADWGHKLTPVEYFRKLKIVENRLPCQATARAGVGVQRGNLLSCSPLPLSPRNESSFLLDFFMVGSLFSTIRSFLKYSTGVNI